MDNDSQLSIKDRKWPRRRLAVFCGLAVLAGLFYYLEEDVRGWLAWQSCKHALEVKGGVLDWNRYIPPPVPDERNFFKAPKMTAWFVKHGGQGTNELTMQLQLNSTPLTIAEFMVVPPASTSNLTSEAADIVLRYSAFGPAVFEESDSPASAQINSFEFADVPVTDAIKALARQAGINYSLDQAIRYHQPGENGQIQPEPVVSVRWENIAARPALLALLNQYGLQIVGADKINGTLITTKDPAAPRIYAAASTAQKLNQVFADKLQNSVCANAIAAQGFLFLTNPIAQIKPVRILLQAERPPEDKELIALIKQFFQNDAVQDHAMGMRVERNAAAPLRVVLDAQPAADYLAWSDQFAPDLDLIRDALKRPASCMDGDYTKPAELPMPSFVAVRMVAQTLAQRAKADLLLGQPDKALQEMTLLHQLCRMLEAAPTGQPITLVAAMINVAVTGLYVTTIAGGIQLRAWQEPQLAALQNQLAEINLPPLVLQAFREEPAGTCRSLETMAVSKWANWSSIASEKWSAKAHHWLFDWLWPHGWTYQNMVHLAGVYYNYQQGFDSAHATISPRNVEAATRAADNLASHGRSPYKYLAAIAIPNFSKAIQTTARNQSSANEAQIVCALERYHLIHGEYPETQDGLMPHFMAAPPHDLIGGAPLIYRRAPGGKFLLYSIGWDATDDGGVSATGWYDSKGDWVWKN